MGCLVYLKGREALDDQGGIISMPSCMNWGLYPETIIKDDDEYDWKDKRPRIIVKANKSIQFERALCRCIRCAYKIPRQYRIQYNPVTYNCKHWAEDMWDCAERRINRSVK